MWYIIDQWLVSISSSIKRKSSYSYISWQVRHITITFPRNYYIHEEFLLRSKKNEFNLGY